MAETFLTVQINPLPNLPVPLGIGQLLSRFLGMRVGVADINLRGRVRLAMKPLLNKVPIIGAVKVQGSTILHWLSCLLAIFFVIFIAYALPSEPGPGQQSGLWRGTFAPRVTRTSI
jgi:hypothetical protein